VIDGRLVSFEGSLDRELQGLARERQLLRLHGAGGEGNLLGRAAKEVSAGQTVDAVHQDRHGQRRVLLEMPRTQGWRDFRQQGMRRIDGMRLTLEGYGGTVWARRIARGRGIAEMRTEETCEQSTGEETIVDAE